MASSQRRRSHPGPTNAAIAAPSPQLQHPGNRRRRRVVDAALDPANDERYLDGTVLVSADSPDTSALIARAIGEHRPIALVFPDGSDVLARPPVHHGLAPLFAVALVRLADRLLRARDRPSFVPREWVTEFHAARLADGPRVVA